MSEIYENLDINNLKIEDYPDYKISNFDKIKSFKYDKINGNILKNIKLDGE